MSIDLAWDALIESSLAANLVDLINRQLASTQRPSFIGPVIVHSFDFGTEPPDIEIVDIRDIYRDFLEDDENEDGSGVNESNKLKGDGGDDDDFEWISRKTAGMGLADDTPSYHHLPPHVRYGRGPATDPFLRTPLSMSVPNLSSPGTASSHMLFRSMHLTPTTPFTSMHSSLTAAPSQATVPSTQQSPVPSHPPATAQDASLSSSELKPDPPPENEHPNLQLHLRITHHSNLRLTLTTSLLINYPSPSFMSLPIKLSVTGLIFTGEVVLAYEGSRKRVHLCILDDLDPYGPASDRSSRPPAEQPSEGKPLPIGMRLLPSILIESEIGQTDKHVLKNVTRVEKFIQDVIRKTVEEELLFPNYHTVMLV